MHYFTTRNHVGKPYKVSYVNFKKATGLKAPYYKKSKKKGKVVEHGYAICPYCGNPVHFVNLFPNHKRKKKKAYARHQRSSIKGLAGFNLATFNSCPLREKKNPSSLLANFETVLLSRNDFMKAIKTEFKLSSRAAEVISRLFGKLYEKDKDSAAQLTFSLLASKNYSGKAWRIIAGIRDENDAISYMEEMGINESEARFLFEEVSKLHENKTSTRDFAHFCAVSAVLLNKDRRKYIGNLAGIFNGIYSVDANAGYVGDAAGTGNIPPQIDNADFCADLDAVNIATRLTKNPNANLFGAISLYYEELNSGKINRAIEFKKAVGIEELKSQQVDFLNYRWSEALGSGAGNPAASYLINKKKIFDDYQQDTIAFNTFVKNIEEGNNEWVE